MNEQDTRHPSTPAGKEEIYESNPNYKKFEDDFRKWWKEHYGKSFPYSASEFAYNYFQKPHPSSQSEQAGENLSGIVGKLLGIKKVLYDVPFSKRQEIADDIGNIAVELSKYAALWQAASQEKDEDLGHPQYAADRINEMYHLLPDCPLKKFLSTWFGSPAPDTVQGQEGRSQAAMFLEVFSMMQDVTSHYEERMGRIKSKFIITER